MNPTRLWRLAGPLVLGAMLAASLAACASLLTEPPRKLYNVAPQIAFAAPLPHVSAQLLVEVPNAPNALDTARVALSRSPVSLDYFADAEWADRAPRLVQGALIQAFEASRAVNAIDRDSLGLRADFVLTSELRHFEAQYDANAGEKSAPRVVVGLNVRLVKIPERKIVAQRAFEQTVQSAGTDVQSVVLAFQEALGAVSRDIVVWAVTNPALSARR